jgi:arylsulfatase A-like enzyme
VETSLAFGPARSTLLVLIALVGVQCSRGEAPEPGPGTGTRYISLSRLAHETIRAEIRGHHEDDRVTLVAEVGQALRIGPLPIGDRCVLHAGLLAGSGAVPALPVRIALETGNGTRSVFEGRVDIDDRSWRDLAIPLPPSAGGEASVAALVLATETPDEQAEAPVEIGWGTPYVACEEPLQRAPAPPRPHVVLISIDTLRADHLGIYGYPRPTSLALDAFAGDALVFDNAFTTSPWTLPAHASMLTGLYPEVHRAGHASIYSPLDPDVVTLAQRLSLAGYDTLANVGGGYVGHAYDLDRGFDEWIDRHAATFESVLPEALDAVSHIGETPTFLFLHTYAVHSPYKLPAGEPSFRTPATGPRPVGWSELAAMKVHLHIELERFHGIEDTIAAYDSSIAFMDRQLARLFELLEARGLLEESLVIVTSDHGESFLERGNYISHGYTFYDEEVRVPLLVRLPERVQAERRTGRVSDLTDLTDVAALVLAVAGVEAEGELAGADPLARLDGRAPARELVRGESAYTGGLYGRTGRWKLMTRVPELGSLGLMRPRELIPDFHDEEQVFDTRNDPSESSNLATRSGELPAAVWQLRQQLGVLEAPGRGSARQDRLDRDQRRQLEALGYIDRISDPSQNPDDTPSAPR